MTATAPDGEVKDEEMEYELDEDWAAKQIDNLITLSNLPSSRWQHLLKLDVIKVLTEVVASNIPVKSTHNLHSGSIFSSHLSFD